MVNISKNPLSKELSEKIFNLLSKIFNKINDRGEMQIFINEFFSYKERVLITKRIAILYLLIKKIEQKHVARVLKVSTSTVCKYALLLENKNFKMINIMKEIIKKDTKSDIVKYFLANLMLQPGFKIGHWKLYWDHKRSKLRKDIYGI